jgi:hypothetical protein
MNARTVKLIDSSRNVLATAQVADEGDHFGGTIDFRSMPASLRSLFDEFEEIVNGQMFSFLDEIQGKIGSLCVKVVFENGHEAPVKDLQVFPSTGEISFRLAEAPSPNGQLA